MIDRKEQVPKGSPLSSYASWKSASWKDAQYGTRSAFFSSFELNGTGPQRAFNLDSSAASQWSSAPSENTI